MSTYPEPPDGSIVGWRNAAGFSAVYERDDAAARNAGYEDDERWYLCDDYSGMGNNPVSWAEIARRPLLPFLPYPSPPLESRKARTPYLLTPTPLTQED